MPLAVLDGGLPDAVALRFMVVVVAVVVMVVARGVLTVLVGMLTVVVLERMLHRDATRPERQVKLYTLLFPCAMGPGPGPLYRALTHLLDPLSEINTSFDGLCTSSGCAAAEPPPPPPGESPRPSAVADLDPEAARLSRSSD